MANTYTLIASNTLSSSAASVTFSSIPSTYTDLVLKCSIRSNGAAATRLVNLTINNTSTNYSWTYIEGNGATASSTRQANGTNIYVGEGNASTSTSNTFSSLEIYIPSYTATQNKPLGSFQTMEDNAASAYMEAVSGLWRNTAAITEVKLAGPGADSFVSGSSFFLYGIKNS